MELLLGFDSPQVLQDLRGMLRRVHLRIGRFDLPFGVDQVRYPAWMLRRRIFGCSVGQSDLPIGIAEQGEFEVELFGERLVLRCRVEADSQDLAVLLLELVGEIAEPATLGRSAGGVGLRIEPEQDVLSAKVGQRERVSLMCLDGEVGCFVSDREHRASFEHGSVRWITELACRAGEIRFSNHGSSLSREVP